jgi:hypothetical protein
MEVRRWPMGWTMRGRFELFWVGVDVFASLSILIAFTCPWWAYLTYHGAAKGMPFPVRVFLFNILPFPLSLVWIARRYPTLHGALPFIARWRLHDLAVVALIAVPLVLMKFSGR